MSQKHMRRSPFSSQVHHAPWPNGFKALSIYSFDGIRDLQGYFDGFNDLIELHQVFKLDRCHCLVVTLIKAKQCFVVDCYIMEAIMDCYIFMLVQSD